MEDKVSLEEYFVAYLNDGIQVTSHDGIFDSLTQLYGSSYFYDHLERELSQSYRASLEIQLIKVKLYLKPNIGEISHVEKDLVSFAETMIKNFRREDVTARTGRYEFYTIFHGSTQELQIAVNRFSSSLSLQNLQPFLSVTSTVRGEEMLNLLHRSDESEKTPIHI